MIGELLAIFVTLARDQDDVTRLRDFDCARDRLWAIGDFLEVIAVKSFFDLGDDFIRIFFARIIRGNNGVIGILIGNLTHEGPLSMVAIAAATENDNQAPRLKFAQGFQNIQ